MLVVGEWVRVVGGEGVAVLGTGAAMVVVLVLLVEVEIGWAAEVHADGMGGSRE